jgi:hypothetical protein
MKENLGPRKSNEVPAKMDSRVTIDWRAASVTTDVRLPLGIVLIRVILLMS